MKLMLNFYNKWKRLLFCLSQCSLIQQATMWSPKTTVSISVICGAFSHHMLTEKLAAGELTLHFSVYLTLCHTDKKALRYLFVGSLTIKITDLLFSKNSYARDLSIIFPKYNPSLSLLQCSFYFLWHELKFRLHINSHSKTPSYPSPFALCIRVQFLQPYLFIVSVYL